MVCPKGHDTQQVGRANNRRCRECRRASDRDYYYRSGWLRRLNRMVDAAIEEWR